MKKRVLCLLLVVCMVMSMAACKKAAPVEDDIPETTQKADCTYTVRVLDPNGEPVSNVGVCVYVDETCAEVAFFNTTDETGVITFEAKELDTYVAVLSDVPEEFRYEEKYPLTGAQTDITLTPGVMTDDVQIVYKLGDLMLDFTVTDLDGNEYNLAQMLEEKEAIILNFYYNDCVPCQNEFPYLQEAYEIYGERVQFFAMNCTDDPEAIAAFKEEYGITFPFVSCEEKWKEMMNITAYPTTVVIDRMGNIVLMHTGALESEMQVIDICYAVTGSDYEQKFYEDISQIEPSQGNGTIDNPKEMGPTPSFEVTVEGGKEYYISFYKLNNLTLQIKDKDAYVLYKGKRYVPNSKGVITLLVTCPDMNTSVSIGFGNSSTETKTFKVTLSAQPGSLDNPYTLKLGENNVTVGKGNDQGVYYVMTAQQDGILRATCLKATAGIKYDCVLYNLNSYAQRTMGEEGAVDDQNRRYVEVKVKKGQKIQMIAAVLPDENWNYPGGSFVYLVEYVTAEVEEEPEIVNVDYTVTVTDEKGAPLGNVKFSTVSEDKTVNFTSNASGVATVTLPEGSYKITMIVPEGYLADKTEFTLTKDAPSCTIKLTKEVIVEEKVEMVDYTVKVVDINGKPIANVTVSIGDKFAVTNAEGKVVLNLEKGEYTAQVSIPAGYQAPTEYAFADGKTLVEVVLDFVPGTINAPLSIYDMEYTTDVFTPGKSVYYELYSLGGLVLNINDPDVQVVMGEQTFVPDEEGLLTVQLPAVGPAEPVLICLTNQGEEIEYYRILFTYPVGHQMNPEMLENLGELTTDLQEGDTDGYFYSWTAPEEGVVTFFVKNIPEGVDYDIVLTNTVNSAVRTMKADGKEGKVSLNVAAGDQITVQIMTVGTQNVATTIVSEGSFVAQENTEDAKLTYTVIVKDTDGNPVADVAVTIGNTQLTTDAAGMASTDLVEGTYTAKITVPEGYKGEVTQVTLTPTENQAQLTLIKVKTATYTVNVTVDGQPYTEQTKVQILENDVPVYEEITVTGTVSVVLPQGNYTVKLTMLENNKLLYDTENVSLTVDAPTLNVALIRPKTYTDYKITVLNPDEKPMSGLLVQVLDGTTLVASGSTDENGLFVAANLLTANYTVELKFSDTSYYYNRQTAMLSGNAAALTIRLAREVDTSKTTTHWMVNDQRIFKLSEGTTHVKVGAGKAYAYAGDDYTDCIFAFQPTRLGMYSIRVDYPGMVVREYGPYVANIISSSTDYEDGTLHYEMKNQSQLDNKLLMLFGVLNIEGVTDVCVTITRIGEPGFSLENLPVSTEWYSGYVPTQQSTPSGTIKYIDITAATSDYEIFYDDTDKEYKIKVNGVTKTLYMNLGTITVQNISLNIIINGDGVAGGSALRKYVKDSEGNLIYKEDYTDVVNSYIAKADTTYGVYRVTKDLAYIVQNAKPGWWDVSSPDYLLTDCNPELGWLFACCYFA